MLVDALLNAEKCLLLYLLNLFVLFYSSCESFDIVSIACDLGYFSYSLFKYKIIPIKEIRGIRWMQKAMTVAMSMNTSQEQFAR